MAIKLTFAPKKYLKVLRKKDNILFHLLLLMTLDGEGNYVINKQNGEVIEEAMGLYVKIPKLENDDNDKRSEDRI
jgi:hypothetical protein